MRFNLIPLEERILLDAAGAASVANTYEAQHATDQAQDQAQQQQQHADNPGAVSGNSDAVDGRVLVISSQVVDHALLADAAKDGITVITYDFNTSLADLADTIADKLIGKEVSSIGFAMLGTDGTFAITNDTLMTAQGLESNIDQQAFWKEMGSLVKNGGSIDILACDVGGNTEGLALILKIDALADSTNHLISVNASVDATGNLSSGGNWDLEVGNVSALDRYFDADKVIHWDGALDIISVSTTPIRFTAYSGDTITGELLAYRAGNVLTDANGSAPGTGFAFQWNLDPSKYAWQQTGVAGVNPSNTVVGYSLSSDGDYRFSPGSAGTFTIYYRAYTDLSTSYGISNVNKIIITVLDTAPVAYAASFTTAEDISYSGVAKATDIDVGQKLTYSIVTQPTHGTVTINSTTGAYVYKPALNYNGPDSFTFKASDGTLTSNAAKININVTPVNDAPRNGAWSPNRETPENTPLTSKVVMATDVDSTVLTYSLVSQPTYGTVVIQPDGTFTYTPKANYIGHDFFSFRAYDGQLYGNVASMEVFVYPVNDAPVAASASATTPEDTPISGVVKATDYDSATSVYTVSSQPAFGQAWAFDTPAPPTLTYSVVSGPSHGTLAFNTNGTYTYTPAANYSGSDSFTYRASDGSLFSNIAKVSLTVTSVNDAPVAAAASAITAEDTPISGSVKATDVDSSTLTYSLVSGPSHGTLAFNANGTYTYTPDANYNGSDSFSYRASDGSLFSNNAAVNLTVTPVNDAPTGIDHSYTDPQNATLTVDASAGLLSGANDVDVGDTLTVILGTGPSKGIINLNSDGSFDYTPAAGQLGIDTFTYRIVDSQGATSELLTATIDITSVNEAPVAYAGVITTAEDTPVQGQVSWTDTDSESFTASVVNQPANGFVVMNADGSYVYTPATDFTGIDTFTFKVNDGQADSAIQTVTVNVTPVNDAAVANAEVITTAEDTPIQGQVSWADPDSTDFTASVVNQPANGSVEMNADGSFVYTPAKDFNGIDTFTFKVNDGQTDSALQTVTVNVTPVDDAPVSAGDTLTTPEDTAIGGTLQATDVDSPTLTYTIVTQPANGSLTVDASGNYVYTPNPNFNGTDSFTFTANDGTSDSNISSVIITVTPVNDAPEIFPSTVSTPEDTPYNGQVLWNDPDSTNFTVTVVQQPQNGTVVMNNDGSYIYTPNPDYNGPDNFIVVVNDGDANSDPQTITMNVGPVDDAPVVTSPTLVTAEDTSIDILPATVGYDIDSPAFSINVVTPPTNGEIFVNADGSVTYKPNADFNGTDTFRYILFDGTTDSTDVGTVTINVMPVNDAPIASSPTLATAEDSALTIPVADLGTDIDGDPLTVQIESQPQHGTVTINPNGSIEYTPEANYNGPDSFTYRINDGSTDSAPGVVNLVVTPVNDAPTATSPTIGVDEDSSVIISAPQLGSDIDGDPLTITISSQPQHGTLELQPDGTVKYTPEADYNGLDNFTYTVNDGSVGSNEGTVYLNVSPVNDAPTANSPTLFVNEDGSLDIPVIQLGNDIDGDSLVVNIITPPANGILIQNPDGSVTYQPNADFNGIDSFQYTVGDNNVDSDVGTATINVIAVNDAPIPKSPTLGLPEDTSLSLSPTDLGTDVDGDPLTITIVTPPANGTLTLNDDGSVTYTPTQDYNGNDSFSYTVNDGTIDSAIGTVKLVIAPVNDAPVVTEPTVDVSEDTQVIIPISDLGSDIDGDTLTVIITNPPEHGTIVVNDNGTVTYTPNPDYTGPDSFTYIVNDGTVNSSEGTAQINVNPVGDGNTGQEGFIPPGNPGGGGGTVNIPDGSPTDLDAIDLGNPFASNFSNNLSNHNIKFLPSDLLNRDNAPVEDIDPENGAIYNGGDGVGYGGPIMDVAIQAVDDNTLKFKGNLNDDSGSLGDGGYQPDDLSKLLFFLGPIVDKTDYAAKKRMGNPLNTRKKNLFRYRERRKIKKFSDLIEFLGLADLSYKRKSKVAVKTENLNTKQRGTLEKNLNPADFGEEFLNKYVEELRALCSMEISRQQFPVLEALAVELLTKYIAAQDLKEGFKIPFPTLNIQGEQVPVEYTIKKVLSLGTSEIPIYFLTAKNEPPILIFRGTKLGFKKISEVRSIIENFNSKGPARAHYNNFLPTLEEFFKDWFSRQSNPKKFRIFGYSQGGVLGQRAIVDFAHYIQTSDKYPSIFFNSPGVEDDYYRAWSARAGENLPSVINYLTTGDVVSKIGTGFIGEVYEINPEVERDILDSHFGVKFLEEDWKLFRVDADAETKSETRAMLNAIQASFLTSEIYKIASAGVERLFAARDKNFTASKAIAVIPTNVVIPSPKAPPTRYQPALENALLNREAMTNTDVLSGHVSYINTDIDAVRSITDSKLSTDLKIITANKTDKARLKLMEAFAKPQHALTDEPEDTSMDYQREHEFGRTSTSRKENLDLTFEPDLYSAVDMSTAALAVMEDIREYLPEPETGTGNKVLDAVKQERNIDHNNH